MMGNPLDWRRIESELEQIARSNKRSLYDYGSESAKDKFMCCADLHEINLTALAKELADRLGGK